MSNIDKQTKSYFIVEIGGADFYFENLQQASEFFSKIVGSPAKKINQLGYGSNAFYYEDGKPLPSMKQSIIEVYPNRKAAEFAKHESGGDVTED